ncbi:MAG: ExsB family transcriptional regulator, partial [Desulfobacterales bacterium]|nr:ExsB family transcriptional regulator [Desulfobacterales bacterium]
MDYKKFIDEQIAQIKKTVGSEIAINALSGGVDSSLVTVLGHKALGNQLKTVFVDNALMRKDEPKYVVDIFAKMG